MLTTCAVGVRCCQDWDTHCLICWTWLVLAFFLFSLYFCMIMTSDVLKMDLVCKWFKGSNWCVIKVRGDMRFCLIPRSALVRRVMIGHRWQLHNCINGGGRTLHAGALVWSSHHQLSFTHILFSFLTARSHPASKRVDRLNTYCI